MTSVLNTIEEAIEEIQKGMNYFSGKTNDNDISIIVNVDHLRKNILQCIVESHKIFKEFKEYLSNPGILYYSV